MEYETMKALFKSGNIIAAIFGSSIAMFFSKRPTTLRDWVRSVFTFLFGVISTGFLTPLIVFYFTEIDVKWIVEAEYSVAFVVGLLSMGVIELIFTFLNKLIKNPKQVFLDIKDFIPFFKK